MNRTHFSISTFFVVLFVAIYNTASYAEPANLGLLTQEVQTYHDSGEYIKEFEIVVNKAQQYINQRSTINQKTRDPEKLAIVLDIDETSLSNYPYMEKRQFVATKKQLEQEVLNADAPALKPMLDLYHDAIKHNVAVFFVTGRHDSMRLATIKNLKEAGFHTWEGLYLKPDDYSLKSVVSYKQNSRKHIEDKGYTIIANIGDQNSDLAGGYSEKTFKLPNPYYYLH